jgi:hypothetical protein
MYKQKVKANLARSMSYNEHFNNIIRTPVHYPQSVEEVTKILKECEGNRIYYPYMDIKKVNTKVTNVSKKKKEIVWMGKCKSI